MNKLYRLEWTEIYTIYEEWIPDVKVADIHSTK